MRRRTTTKKEEEYGRRMKTANIREKRKRITIGKEKGKRWNKQKQRKEEKEVERDQIPERRKRR